MTKIKGQNLRLLIDNKRIACATSCQLHVSANLEDSSSKDDTGNWGKQECTGKTWDGSTDALVIVDDTDNAMKAFDGVEMVGKEVTVEVDLTEGEQNRVTSKGLYRGNAIINDWSLTAGNKQNATYTVQFQGNGPLEAVPAESE